MPSVWDFTASLAKQSCPTWVIDGDHDYFDPARRIFAAAMAEDDRVHVVSVVDAGHGSWVDDPKGIAKDLREALESGSHCGKD
jgi:pimeloyl-ACP methyl ester carboxylesterase